MYQLKKSLGQHFLDDSVVVEKIVNELKALKFSRLLEVGPGGGALTKDLMNISDIDFKVIEIDIEKVVYLKKKFPSLHIISGDFLKSELPFQESFTIIGNFPYNISSQILFKIFDWYPLVNNIIGMFQKEVAKRIVSGPGNKDYGILSILVQYLPC